MRMGSDSDRGSRKRWTHVELRRLLVKVWRLFAGCACYGRTAFGVFGPLFSLLSDQIVLLLFTIIL